ncbi:hypothetical protein J6590_063829 [Homalodisca vitripennis]|nr:hypothetical protein J6590_063829 [Homalodisca vitripennis]
MDVLASNRSAADWPVTRFGTRKTLEDQNHAGRSVDKQRQITAVSHGSAASNQGSRLAGHAVWAKALKNQNHAGRSVDKQRQITAVSHGSSSHNRSAADWPVTRFGTRKTLVDQNHTSRDRSLQLVMEVAASNRSAADWPVTRFGPRLSRIRTMLVDL